jgi:hypothetical protein
MIVGFTGTREGMALAQYRRLIGWIRGQTIAQFHHGCCVGADEEAFDLVATFTKAEIHAHPSTLRSMTSNTALLGSHVKHSVQLPLTRNRDIVMACDILLATPLQETEELRSGTWATIRYAWKTGKPVRVFWPDGTIHQ